MNENRPPGPRSVANGRECVYFKFSEDEVGIWIFISLQCFLCLSCFFFLDSCYVSLQETLTKKGPFHIITGTLDLPTHQS